MESFGALLSNNLDARSACLTNVCCTGAHRKWCSWQQMVQHSTELGDLPTAYWPCPLLAGPANDAAQGSLLVLCWQARCSICGVRECWPMLLAQGAQLVFGICQPLGCTGALLACCWQA